MKRSRERNNRRQIKCSECSGLMIFDYFKKHCTLYHKGVVGIYAQEPDCQPLLKFFKVSWLMFHSYRSVHWEFYAMYHVCVVFMYSSRYGLAWWYRSCSLKVVYAEIYNHFLIYFGINYVGNEQIIFNGCQTYK